MNDPAHSLIAVFVILQIKHFVCDYLLQTPYQLLNKGIYLHPGGLLHAGLHALFTMGAFLVASPSVALGIAIVVGEFLIHYHIDWVKEQVIQRKGWDATQRNFWWAIGFDQLLHHLTYIVIAGLLVGVF